MRRKILPTLSLALLLSGVTAYAQTVAGHVFSSTSGAGIAGMKVEISRRGGNESVSLTTDPQGDFLAENLSVGAYTIRYLTYDYWPNPNGSHPPITRTWGRSSQTIQVVAGSGTVKVEAQMMPLARINVHVVDGGGMSVPGAFVRIIGPTLQSVAADAKGTLKSYGLSPGAYEISALPSRGMHPPAPDPDTGTPLGWSKTYYPGVASQEAASKIRVYPGQVLDVELKLLAVPVHTIRGVLFAPDGKPAQNVPVKLWDGLPVAHEVSTKSGPDGAFVFRGVVNGEWQLQAALKNEEVPTYAFEWVEIRDSDIENVKLQLDAPFTVRGKIVMETSEGASTPAQPSVVKLTPDPARFLKQIGAVVGKALESKPDAQGNFLVDNIYPGQYEISAPIPTPSHYLDAILVNDAEVTTPEVTFSGTASLTLIYKNNGGVVQGTVEDCPAGGDMWLFPEEITQRRNAFAHYATCDGSGQYTIKAVRPGDYYVMAVAGDLSLTGRAATDPMLLRQASKVTVRSGQMSTVNLRAIALPSFY